jgi:CRP-like cAMP-binding protein
MNVENDIDFRQTVDIQKGVALFITDIISRKLQLAIFRESNLMVSLVEECWVFQSTPVVQTLYPARGGIASGKVLETPGPARRAGVHDRTF